MDVVTKLLAIAQADYAMAKLAGIEYTLTPEALAIKEITESRDKLAKLEKFMDIAAGEGLMLGGIDAAELYLECFGIPT